MSNDRVQDALDALDGDRSIVGREHAEILGVEVKRLRGVALRALDAADAAASPSRIRSEFDVHMLNEMGVGKAITIAETFSGALDRLEAQCGVDGREMAIVRTKLQEAAFYAKRAMAVRPENQK